MEQSLDEKELSLFQQKMQKEDFAQQVAEESVRLSSRSKLQTELKKIHTEVVSSQPRRRRRMAMAAAFGIFILSITLYYFFTKEIPSNHSEIAFAKYFEPYPNVFEQRGTPGSEDQKLRRALVAYDRQNYAEANLLFAALLEKEAPENSYTPFYYAISLLAKQQAEEAIPLLEAILSNESALLKSEAQWYLALAYLQINQKETARKILLDFQSESKGFKKEEANLLLKEI